MQTPSTAYPDPRYFGVSSVTGRRSANEDAWAAPSAAQRGTAGACYVVADGVGGQSRGDLAAQTAAEATLRVYYERAAAGDDPPTALGRAVAAANHEVYQLSRKLGIEQMGCTLVAAAIGGGRLHVAHVGDARAQLLQGGQLFLLTRDHTWVQEQVDRGTITPEDAARHEFRHIVTRVLGNDAQVDITFSAPVTPGPDDLLIMSSDGLHDVVPAERIARVAGGAPPPTAAQALTTDALNLGSEDNVTVMIVAAGVGTVAAGGPSTASGRVPTVRIQRPPPNTAAAPAPRRGAFWPAVLLAAIGLLAVVGLLAILSRGGGNAPDAAPTAAVPPTLGAAYPGPTTRPGPAAPTSTVAPTAYPPAGDAGGFPTMCIVDNGSITYLWEIDDPDRGLCYGTDKIAPAGARVYQLGDATEKRGQLNTTECYTDQFVRVRTLEDPPLEGWVLEKRVASCRE